MEAEAGLEPGRHCWRGILSLLCLPIPPPGLTDYLLYFISIIIKSISVNDLVLKYCYLLAIAINVSVASILLRVS